jgi:hypothetical protein
LMGMQTEGKHNLYISHVLKEQSGLISTSNGRVSGGVRRWSNHTTPILYNSSINQ